MLTFRSANLVFAVVLAALIGWQISAGFNAWYYVALIVLYSAVLFYGCYYTRSNFFMKVFCKASTTEKVIAITFDDGPHATGTPQILSILRANNVEAAFFCIGKNIAGNESILQQIIAEGHLIGNHSYTHHFWFDMFSSQKMLDDMRLMDSETRNATSLLPKLFRPPYGVMNPNLRKAIQTGGYTPVGWSVRSMDTVNKDSDALLNKMLKKLNPGAVFLFHDTSAATIAMLPQFIIEAHVRGYKFMRADKMLNLQAYA